MAGPGRRRLLCEQADPPALTGIDFVRVDPAGHRVLSVFFVIEPDALARPVDTTMTEFTARIADFYGEEIPVESHAWATRIDASGAPRLTLTVTAEREGGFQTYRLSLTDAPADAGPSRLDRFCAEIDFSFKQPCPSPFDCEQEPECPEEPRVDYPVDYLARDFESFRRALIAYSEDRHPGWEARVPADFGGMVSELFAALGDDFSYMQDRVQREGYLSTLTQRRSFQQLARLVDYSLDPGEAAAGLVSLRLYEGERRPATLAPVLVEVPSGARVWAYQEDSPPIPYELGETLAEMIAGVPRWPVHSHWSDLPAYQPDPETPCLPVGAREMILAEDGLLVEPFPPEVLGTDISGYWVGRSVLIETRPTEPEAPDRRVIVTLDEPVTRFTDPLTGAEPLLRLHWREEDALPFELDQSSAFVSANLAPARAGMALRPLFVAGANDDPALAELPRTIERAGPAREGGRAAIHRFTLEATVNGGLGWTSGTDDAGAPVYQPDVVMEQLDPDAGDALVAEWRVGVNGLSLAETDEAATLEPGRWGVVFGLERRGVRFEHRDYAGDAGWTIRFGDGVFGRPPTAGDLFRVTYRTGPGRAGNIPPDTLTRSDPPPDAPTPLQSMPPAPPPIAVRNPLAFTGGRDPQSLDLGRRIAPAAYKAIVLRAVRDEDYRAQAERLDWVQQAGAVTRWTGAWPTTFVSADPEGAFAISPERFDELESLLGAVRQVGRRVIARQPVFLPLDLRIAICLAPGTAFGAVAKRVIDALSPRRGGFFHPDRFSFGDSLRRPALEAAIACVEGVAAVLEIRLRIRGVTAWRIFAESELGVADDRILKVENDPERPGQGSIRVYRERIPESEAA